MQRPPYARDVGAALAAGRDPNVHLFAADNAGRRAERRIAHEGPGTALVLRTAR